MKILVVGGTGLIGGHAALYLAAEGHAVTIAGRKPPAPDAPLAALPFLRGDYLATADLGEAELARFDALVFAAGNDIRHLPEGVEEASHWQRANVEGVPAFFARARTAGIGTAVHIGSFYPHVAPQLVERVPYVRSRKLETERVCALARDGFAVTSLDAPFVVGTVAGLPVPMFAAYTRWAQGATDMPASAPPGGVNFISTRSLSEAVAGALLRGTSGTAYLVGDENLSFADYFQLFFDAAGSKLKVATVDAPHPFLPDATLYAGRGAELFYEPDPHQTATLGYARNDIRRAIEEVVAQYRAEPRDPAAQRSNA